MFGLCLGGAPLLWLNAILAGRLRLLVFAIMAPVGSKSRVSLSLSKKKEILQELQTTILSKTELAKKYNIPKSTLSTIIKAKDKVLKSDGSTGLAPGRKRSREAKNPALEDALVLWMKKIRGQNIPIDGKLLKEQADTYALRMGIDCFKGSDGWLQKFKARHGLTFNKVCGESASVNPEVVRQWKEERLKNLLRDYDPEDIFNADETGLMWKLLPDRTLTFKDEKCSGGKRAKNRITLLMTANMSGTEKLPLLVIGKSQKPRCFKGIKYLPTTYKANRKAWMTASLYEEWLRQLDRQFANKGRKILLIVDNCTAHVQVSGLKAIHVEFLPPNVTSVLQPLDQGIIQNFKRNYRRMLLQRIILNLENGKEYSVSLLSAIHTACSAWNSVTQATIANCFRHAGFAVDVAVDDVEVDDIGENRAEDNDLLDALRQRNFAVPKETSFDDYINVDADIICNGDLTDNEIIQQAMSSKEKACSLPDDLDEDDDNEESESKPTSKELAVSIAFIRRHFEQEGLDSADDSVNLVNVLEGRIFKSIRASLKQSKITGYFPSETS